MIPRELPGLGADLPAFKGGASSAGAAGLAGISAPQTMGGVSSTQSGSFSNLLESAVGEINGKMQTAQAEQAKVLSGESTNLHQAMIAMQESSTAFTLMVEVRNKLVESYQELMRMQV